MICVYNSMIFYCTPPYPVDCIRSIWHVPFQKRQKTPMFSNMGKGNTTYHRAQRAAMFAYLDIIVARYGIYLQVH